MDSLEENVITVPLGTDLTDFTTKKTKSPQHTEDASEVFRILDTPTHTPKKLKSNPVLMVQTVQSPAPQINTTVTKLTTQVEHIRERPVSHDVQSKTLLESEVPVRTQSKSSILCTKILIPTDTQQSHQDDLLPIPTPKEVKSRVEVKSELSGFSEDNLPAFTSAMDKTASQGSVLCIYLCNCVYLVVVYRA